MQSIGRTKQHKRTDRYIYDTHSHFVASCFSEKRTFGMMQELNAVATNEKPFDVTQDENAWYHPSTKTTLAPPTQTCSLAQRRTRTTDTEAIAAPQMSRPRRRG